MQPRGCGFKSHYLSRKGENISNSLLNIPCVINSKVRLNIHIGSKIVKETILRNAVIKTILKR